jgi:dTDP-4-dehydrorhamnose 3,5-epimerase
MKVTPLAIADVLLIELSVFEDERGFFVARYHTEQFREYGLPTAFVQDNHSRSRPGVMRALHLQHTPAQGKLVGVIRGRIWDVAVDIRPDSPTFKQHVSIELSDLNGRLLWIPAGFLHGFCVLGDEPADVLYKVDAPYNSKGESGVIWNDPDLAVPWPIQPTVVSARDQAMPSFAEFCANPIDWGTVAGPRRA